MKYKNAKNILPEELINQIQEYIQGDIIYIPIQRNKVSWGEKSGAKDAINSRNKEIFDLYNRGYSLEEIQGIFNLSESSIRKIISKIKKSNLCLGGRENE
ncbi:CD3324 family protein [Intestinibacter sp.]|uniref:CD3324 family protein n=1 Tax=Intestinibacter sp. TaxID=1965304 RepID=UPI003F18C741